MNSFVIKFICSGCKNVFQAICNVRQDDNTFVKGLLCDKCANQSKLELDFQV